MKSEGIFLVLVTLLAVVKAYMELPKFSQMKLLYPGYYLHGGKYRDKDVIALIGGNAVHPLHNTASIRMSWVFNKFGGQHSIGTEPIFLSKRGRDSYTGKDNIEYIFQNTAYGPFLAEKYGNPLVTKPDKSDPSKTMIPFMGKQGIVRLVSYRRKHAAGHIGLWDCDHFYQSRDWTTEHHMISVEFWEAPDSFCPEKTGTDPPPHLQKVDMQELHLVPRHNFGYEHFHEEGRPHKKSSNIKIGRHQRKLPRESTMWLQR